MMYNYVRISSAVPRVSVASVTKNTAEIIEKIYLADASGADYMVFPELALTGCTCGDLFFQKTSIDGVKKAFCEIAAVTEALDITVIVGAPVELDGNLLNAAAVFSGGRLCGIVPKTSLSCGAYDQTRYFIPASLIPVESICSKDLGLLSSYPVPIGTNTFRGRGGETFAVAFGTKLAELSVDSYAEILFCLDASYETVGSRAFRQNLVKITSKAKNMALVYVSAGANESTTDFVFHGHSMFAENGKLLAENKLFIDDDYLLNADIDLDIIRADRRKNKSILALSPKPAFSVYAPVSHREKRDDYGVLHPIRKFPFVPETDTDLTERCLQIYQMQTAALAKRLSIAAEKVVIGVSGGLDSTLALLVCVGAMKKLHRPTENVIGVTMPCFGTTSRTYQNALDLMKTLGVTSREIAVKDACMQHFKDIGHDVNVKDVTFENAQARERTQVLMDVANDENALVCGTGDLSELALGWCTYNADHMSMYGVNAGIPKTLLKHIIETLAGTETFKTSGETLRDIADTPISPELLPPDENGNIAQKTEDSVGPYALHDFFIYYALRYGFTFNKIELLACRAFADDYDRETVHKWLTTFYRRFFTQQYKRSCLPDGVKIGTVGISPRGDLHMPSDASFYDYLG